MGPFKYPNNHPKLNDLKFEEKHKQNVFEAINHKEPRKTAKKKIAFTGIAAAALLVIFIGSAYFSPTMAKVAAKIPYFSLFIKQEEYKYALYDVISENLSQTEYDLRNMKVSVPKREITLSFGGSKEAVHNLKDELMPIINASLKANNFGTYDIEIIRDKTVYNRVQEDSPEVEKYIKDSQELKQKVIEQLKKHKYEMAFPVQARINAIEKYIFVAIPKTETRMADLETLLRTTAQEYGDDFKLDIRTIDMDARTQEKRWEEAGIISILVGGLMENEEFKVTGFSYSFHPLPLQIKIKTSINSTDAKAKEHVERIEEEINTFIQTDELTKNVRNDPYELTILGKDKKQIK